MVPARGDESSADVGGCVVAMAKRPTMRRRTLRADGKVASSASFMLAA